MKVIKTENLDKWTRIRILLGGLQYVNNLLVERIKKIDLARFERHELEDMELLLLAINTVVCGLVELFFEKWESEEKKESGGEYYT